MKISPMKILMLGGAIAVVSLWFIAHGERPSRMGSDGSSGQIGILAVQASRTPDYPPPLGAHLLHLVPEDGQDVLFIWEDGCWRGVSALSEQLILSRADSEVNVRLIPGIEGSPWRIQINEEYFDPKSGNVFHVSCQGGLKEIDRAVTGPQEKEFYWDLIDAVFEEQFPPNKSP